MVAGYFTYKEVLFPGLTFSPETLSYVQNEFQVRDDDGFNVTYPKSVCYGSWFNHVTGWMGLRGDKNFFFITYEELQQDPWHSVQRICQFLGKELSEEQVAAVMENASFQSMKENKMSNFSQVPDEYMDNQKVGLMRKGICGDQRNHL